MTSPAWRIVPAEPVAWTRTGYMTDEIGMDAREVHFYRPPSDPDDETEGWQSLHQAEAVKDEDYKAIAFAVLKKFKGYPRPKIPHQDDVEELAAALRGYFEGE